MIRGLYTSVSGLISLENKQAVISNNMANANTTGYKSKDLSLKSFKEVMLSNKENVNGINTKKNIGKVSLGVLIEGEHTRFTQGDFKETNKIGDFSIDGRGFFAVQKGDETLYTRDGKFRVNNEGYLVTSSGDNVLGRVNGRVEKIFVGGDKFILDENKNLNVGSRKYELLTADFKDYHKDLKEVGDNYYKGENPIYNADVSVYQGFIETSNVNITDQMVEMLSTMRSFETNQRFVTMIDDSLGKAANEIGRV